MHKYILTHKDMEPVDGFEIIDNRDNKELDHRIWSELAGMQKVYDLVMKNKYEDSEFISLNHYRRIIDPDCVNRTYIAQPIILQSSIAQHYAACHFIEDLQLMGNAIKECYPNMVQASEQIINGNIFIPYNIVNCTCGQFCDWYKFVFTILKKVFEYIGNPTFEQMKEIISKREQPNLEYRNNNITYQSRVSAFLSERISTIYWLTAAKKIPIFPAKVNLLEEGQKI